MRERFSESSKSSHQSHQSHQSRQSHQIKLYLLSSLSRRNLFCGIIRRGCWLTFPPRPIGISLPHTSLQFMCQKKKKNGSSWFKKVEKYKLIRQAAPAISTSTNSKVPLGYHAAPFQTRYVSPSVIHSTLRVLVLQPT